MQDFGLTPIPNPKNQTPPSSVRKNQTSNKITFFLF